MHELKPIPIERSDLNWRLNDPAALPLPTAHLQQFTALDPASADWLVERTKSWYAQHPFTPGIFEKVETMRLAPNETEEDASRIRKWLFRRGIPFGHRVYLSWSPTEAAISNWKMFVRYWDDLWVPSDDLAVFDDSLSWALFLSRYEEAYFATRPTKS